MNETCHLCDVQYMSTIGLRRHVALLHDGNWNGVDDEPLPPRQLRRQRFDYVIEEEP